MSQMNGLVFINDVLFCSLTFVLTLKLSTDEQMLGSNEIPDFQKSIVWMYSHHHDYHDTTSYLRIAGKTCLEASIELGFQTSRITCLPCHIYLCFIIIETRSLRHRENQNFSKTHSFPSLRQRKAWPCMAAYVWHNLAMPLNMSCQSYLFW